MATGPPACGMLRVWGMSGEELAAVNLGEHLDVRDLKSSLCRMHGLPRCMQQLLYHGKRLDDFTKLDAPMDIQLLDGC